MGNRRSKPAVTEKEHYGHLVEHDNTSDSSALSDTGKYLITEIMQYVFLKNAKKEEEYIDFQIKVQF